jgi:iron only hydrogenase large subunit-like protein
MIYEFLTLPFVEIELRLGTILKNRFDASIDKKYFEKIKESLEATKWNQIVNKNTVEYIETQEKGSVIKYITDITGSETRSVLLKENVSTEDFALSFSPFDVRYSINQEFKLNSQTFVKNESSFIRNKVRKSFVADNFKYDLTIVNENNEGIVKTKYEIEIELIVNENTLSWTPGYLNDFLECKVYDLVNIVEAIDRKTFKINFIKG